MNTPFSSTATPTSKSTTTPTSTQGALAIFVKTPGLSPIKTRLATSIGPALTLEFYQLAVIALKEMAAKLKDEIPNLELYFAVAEREGLESPLWTDLPTLWQGEGSLGTRLSCVYDQLLKKHSFVSFIGADSPHISFAEIYKAILTVENSKNTDFTLGKTDDGGFYFFGGGMPIPQSRWESVEFSTNTTADDLMEEFSAMANFRELPQSFDIDTIEDLRRYHQETFPLYNLLKEQLNLISWARRLK